MAIFTHDSSRKNGEKMNLTFTKMQGAGNDFIVMDIALLPQEISPQQIRFLCDRHRGVGADGVILLEKASVCGSPHKMFFFNNDGSPADACGNGLRCAASFLSCLTGERTLQIHCGKELFHAEICSGDLSRVSVLLPLGEPFTKVDLPEGFTVYKGVAGVPHGVLLCSGDPESFDVENTGRFLRNHKVFAPEGINVDFLWPDPEKGIVTIRTYERGVEAETLACGTGCSSAGVVLHQFFHFPEKVSFLCRGKECITVEILKDCSKLSTQKILLTGPAQRVFEGTVEL